MFSGFSQRFSEHFLRVPLRNPQKIPFFGDSPLDNGAWPRLDLGMDPSKGPQSFQNQMACLIVNDTTSRKFALKNNQKSEGRGSVPVICRKRPSKNQKSEGRDLSQSSAEKDLRKREILRGKGAFGQF